MHFTGVFCVDFSRGFCVYVCESLLSHNLARLCSCRARECYTVTITWSVPNETGSRYTFSHERQLLQAGITKIRNIDIECWALYRKRLNMNYSNRNSYRLQLRTLSFDVNRCSMSPCYTYTSYDCIWYIFI